MQIAGSEDAINGTLILNSIQGKLDSIRYDTGTLDDQIYRSWFNENLEAFEKKHCIFMD